MPPVETPSMRRHRRQRTWQILVPFLLMTGLIVAAAILVAAGGESQARLWADISIIWLLSPLLVLALLVTVLLGLLIYGLAQLARVTPHYTVRAQHLAARVQSAVQQSVDWVVKPFIWIQQAIATVESFLSRLSKQ